MRLCPSSSECHANVVVDRDRILSIAGSDTTRAAMSWWTLAMLLYPGVQKRAQEELDSVVGRSRLPTFADMSQLPFICALVKEVVRWRPVTPMGM